MAASNGKPWFNLFVTAADQWLFCTCSADTAWDFPQDLGNLGVDLGFGDFAMQSWDFYCHNDRNILSEISTSPQI